MISEVVSPFLGSGRAGPLRLSYYLGFKRSIALASRLSRTHKGKLVLTDPDAHNQVSRQELNEHS